jgi:hypothetical protein
MVVVSRLDEPGAMRRAHGQAAVQLERLPSWLGSCGPGQDVQFLKTGVTPASHAVEWLASVTSGTAVAINRIQEINIHTP